MNEQIHSQFRTLTFVLIVIKLYLELSITEQFHLLPPVNVHSVRDLIDEHNQLNHPFVIHHFLHLMVDYQMDSLHRTNSIQQQNKIEINFNIIDSHLTLFSKKNRKQNTRSLFDGI